MVVVVDVDFSGAEDPKLSRLKHKIPQFFSYDFEPLRPANRYLRHISRKLAIKSIKTIAEHVKEFLLWSEDSDIKTEYMTDNLFDLYIEVLCGYRKKNGEPLSWNTVNARTSGAYRYLIWCYEQGCCSGLDPREAGTTSRSARKRYDIKGHPSRQLQEPTKFLLLDQAVKFIEAFSIASGKSNDQSRRRNKLIGALMLQTGLRISEVTNFPLKDLPEINSRGHSTPARIIGKGRKARLVLIPNALLLKLWDYRDIDREALCDKLRACGRNKMPEELFISNLGRGLTSNWIEKLFVKAGHSMGIKAVPHTLRHTYGTYHYLLNKDLAGLANLMGHANETTTRNYYVHTAVLTSYAGSYSKLQDEVDKLIEA